MTRVKCREIGHRLRRTDALWIGGVDGGVRTLWRRRGVMGADGSQRGGEAEASD